jgi:hypothetical protein
MSLDASASSKKTKFKKGYNKPIILIYHLKQCVKIITGVGTYFFIIRCLSICGHMNE